MEDHVHLDSHGAACYISSMYIIQFMQALYEKECSMALQDRVQEQTNEAKNALEAYVYSLRNKMYDALAEFVTDDWKESTSKQLEQMEVCFLRLRNVCLLIHYMGNLPNVYCVQPRWYHYVRHLSGCILTTQPG